MLLFSATSLLAFVALPSISLICLPKFYVFPLTYDIELLTPEKLSEVSLTKDLKF